jgi:3-deoxy-D-manno-octulosonate 8-phosphate phosphatase (KDO 8-P phosphatase)
MADDLKNVKAKFEGSFLQDPAVLQAKLSKIKAFVFDWDGVFNDGKKDEHGSSPFSEVDSMGVNMLRFNHYLHTGELPVAVIISGEKNRASFQFAAREHFHAAYYKIADKRAALEHVCRIQGIEPHEIAFFFDDVLDLAFAEQCGLRIMVGRPCNPFLIEYAERKHLADYITALDGSHHAIREAADLLMGIRGLYDETISQRSYFADSYKEYLRLRNAADPVFYAAVHSEIKEQSPQ